MAILAIIIAALLGYAITVVSVIYPNTTFAKGYMFDYDFMKDFITGTFYYIVTVIGVISSIIYRKIEKNDERITRAILKDIFLNTGLIKAFIVSPMVFAGVINAFGKDANTIMTIIFAYQNGFFWETVMKMHRSNDI